MTTIAIIIAAIAVLYLTCFLLSYGAHFAHRQNRHPNVALDWYWHDRSEAIIKAKYAPFTLWRDYFRTEKLKHGLKFW